MDQVDCKRQIKGLTEFGAKVSLSVVNGYSLIDRFSFEAYNKGEAFLFEAVVEKYRQRLCHYPSRILADKIYRSKGNRSFCKDHGIRMSGPKLGRPGNNHAADIRQELQKIGERNGKIGNVKRKLGLSLIMSKLQVIAGSMIRMDIFILNMKKMMGQESSLL